MTEIEQVIEKQLNAYNNKSIDEFCECYADDIVLAVKGEVKLEGLENLRNYYAKLFQSSPNLTATILERTVLQNHVIDIEKVTGRLNNAHPTTVTAKYTIRENKISRVDFMDYIED
jgi:uncharacterized protein (TIGR02246 family)